MVIAALLLVCAETAAWRRIRRNARYRRRTDCRRSRATTFSGSEAKKAASALPDINVDVVASKAMSGPSRIVKPWACKPRARALPFGVGEGVGPRDHGDDVADVERDHMVLQRCGRHAGPLQRVGCDRHQAIEFAAVAVRHRTSATPTAARRASARGRNRPTPPRYRAGSPSASVRRRRSRPMCRSARSAPGRIDPRNG